MLNKPSSHPVLMGEVFHFWDHFCGPPLDALQQVPVCPVPRSPHLDAVLQRCLSSAERRGRSAPPRDVRYHPPTPCWRVPTLPGGGGDPRPGSAAAPRGGGRCGERRQSPPGSCPRGAAAPPRTWARPAEGGRAQPVLCGAARRREHGPGRRGPGALSGAMRGRLLARLRRRRLLRLLLALGALALGLWAAYLELLAAAGPGGGAGPVRSKYHPSRSVPRLSARCRGRS